MPLATACQKLGFGHWVFPVADALLVLTQLEEAKSLMRDTIAAGIFTDLGSGSNVDLCVITQAGVELLRGYDRPTCKAERWISDAPNVTCARPEVGGPGATCRPVKLLMRPQSFSIHLQLDQALLAMFSVTSAPSSTFSLLFNTFLCVFQEPVQIQTRDHSCPHQNRDPPVCGNGQPVCPGHGHGLKDTHTHTKLEHKVKCAKALVEFLLLKS